MPERADLAGEEAGLAVEAASGSAVTGVRYAGAGPRSRRTRERQISYEPCRGAHEELR